jgi:hypothetical protein
LILNSVLVFSVNSAKKCIKVRKLFYLYRPLRSREFASKGDISGESFREAAEGPPDAVRFVPAPGRLTRALTGSRPRLSEPAASLQRVSLLPGSTPPPE